MPTYSLTLSGLSAAKLRDSASGTADFTWTGGSLRHVVAGQPRDSHAFSKFAGKVVLQDGTFTLTDCKLQSGGASYSVKGTASYDRIARHAAGALRRAIVCHLRNAGQSACGNRHHARGGGFVAMTELRFPLASGAALAPWRPHLAALARVGHENHSADFRAMEQKLAYLKTNGAKAHPDPKPTELTDRKPTPTSPKAA